MSVASGNVHAEYYDPVGIRKAMDLCTVGCWLYIIFSKTFDTKGKILIVR